MEVISLFCHNSLRNLIYILVDRKSNEAICIDPFDAQMVNKRLEKENLKLTKIINTHEHWDHIQGNDELKELTGCEILSVRGVNNSDQTLSGGEQLSIGETNLDIIATPGHTMNHVCILSESMTKNGAKKRIFSGDMLFNAGVGRCSNGGSVETMFNTFETFFKDLEDDVLVYPGHDYIENNLGFAKEQNPNNEEIDQMLEVANEVKGKDSLIVTTMGQERAFNPFLRLESAEIQSRTGTVDASREDVFTQLRTLRDSW